MIELVSDRFSERILRAADGQFSELVSDHFSERTLRAVDGYPSVLCSLPSSFLGANPFL